MPIQPNMQTIEEIKNKYPDIFINTSGGADSFKPDAPIVERDPIAVVIKHPSEDMYLISKWKQSNWCGFLTGGIEDGDTLEQTVAKEVHEETGFKHVTEILPLDCVSHGLFFHPIKNVNRLAHYHLVFAQLENLEHDKVSEMERAIADFVWVPAGEVHDLLTHENMRILWRHYVSHIDSV